MILICRGKQKDYVDIAKIHFSSWKFAYSTLLPESYITDKNSLSHKKEMWKEVIAHPNVSVWIAYDCREENNHTALGFIGCFNEGSGYEITTLYVLPEYQRLGIGSQLMTVALNHIRESHLDFSLNLWVLKNNIPAINFYSQHGFIPSKEISEEWYEDTKIVDIKMIKSAPR